MLKGTQCLGHLPLSQKSSIIDNGQDPKYASGHVYGKVQTSVSYLVFFESD